MSLIELLYFIGITVEASSGAITANYQKMDLFGIILVANAAAFGGGTLRDVLIGHAPLTWVKHPNYLYLTTTAAIATVFLIQLIEKRKNLFLVLDALGLSAFAVIGYTTAKTHLLPATICVLMGTLTGMGGGLLRDILVNQVPLVLRKEIYATAAIAGLIILALLDAMAVNFAASSLACCGLILLLRLFAIQWQLELPKVPGNP